MNKQENENILTIQLIRYVISNDKTESYYFLEMSTLQVTTLLDKKTLIDYIEIYSYNSAGEYLSIETINSFKTIQKFNDFFLNHDYYISDCKLSLANGFTISSHDDGEVTINVPTGNDGQNIISNVFKAYNLSNSLISYLKSKQGQYIVIDQNSTIIKSYSTFDEYLEDNKI